MTLLAEAHFALGQTLFYAGAFNAARASYEQALALADREQHHVYRIVENPTVTGLYLLSHTLWYLGYPDQAVSRQQEAVTLAHDLARPHILVEALAFAAWLHVFRREPQTVQARAETAIALTTEHELPRWGLLAAHARGWVLAAQGDGEEVLARMHQNLAEVQALGDELGGSIWLAALADAYKKLGQEEKGLQIATKALERVSAFGDRAWEAELHRLQGELRLQQGPDNVAEAEVCFHKALDVASQQQAKSWELRAATSLARLWQQQGKTAEARDLLAPVYDWFTEGFDTADLKDAQALLAELS